MPNDEYDDGNATVRGNTVLLGLWFGGKIFVVSVAGWVWCLMFRALARNMEIARLTTRSRVRIRRAGIGSASSAAPMAPTRLVVPPVKVPRAWTTWSWAVCRAMVKDSRSGSTPGCCSVAPVIAVRNTW